MVPQPRQTEFQRWFPIIQVIFAAALSIAGSWGLLQREIAIVKASEQNHFEEVLRRLDLMGVDIRELRESERRR